MDRLGKWDLLDDSFRLCKSPIHWNSTSWLRQCNTLMIYGNMCSGWMINPLPQTTYSILSTSLSLSVSPPIRLYELRKNGIRTFHGGHVFHKHRARRLSKIRNKREDTYENMWEWKQLVAAYDGAGGSNPNGSGHAFMAGHSLMNAHLMTQLAVKRKSTPLEILGLPGYDKLTEEEKELCSIVRLVPLSYIGYKTILTAENSKTGYLRLADARRLIKIDVNKTRQLYDFLLKSGFIDRPFN